MKERQERLQVVFCVLAVIELRLAHDQSVSNPRNEYRYRIQRLERTELYMKQTVCSYLLMVVGLSKVTANSLQSKLLNDVLDDYKAALKPRCGSNSTTVVNMNIGFRQILDLDEPKQVINCIIWIRLSWNDCRLRWNATAYGGIESLTLSQEAIWVPDITLYDSAKNTLSGFDRYKLVIRHDGLVKYNFPSIITSICAVDVTHFPFDYQVCRLTFGSWVYPIDQLDIRHTDSLPDTTEYVSNGEWRLVGAHVIRKPTDFGSNTTFALLTFVIPLQRLPLFYVLNLLFPCMLITLVAILGFLLPTVSGEKVHIEITLMVSFALFQLIVLELMPHTSQTVPFISLYFLVSMLLVGMSCLMTVVVLNVHYKGGRGLRLPAIVRTHVMRPLARVFRVDSSPWLEIKRTARETMRRGSSYSCSSSRVQSRPDIYSMASGEFYDPSSHSSSNDQTSTVIRGIDQSTSSDVDSGVDCVATTSGRNKQSDDIVATLHSTTYNGYDIVDALQGITNKLEAVENYLENTDRTVASEWETFAIVLDRLFITIYIVFLVTSVTVLSIKYIYFSEMPDT